MFLGGGIRNDINGMITPFSPQLQRPIQFWIKGGNAVQQRSHGNGQTHDVKSRAHSVEGMTDSQVNNKESFFRKNANHTMHYQFKS